MHFSTLALFATSVSGAAVERALAWRQGLATPQPFQAPSGQQKTSNYLKLERGAASSRSAIVLQSLRNSVNTNSKRAGGTAPLIPLQGVEYLINLQFGSSPTVKAIVDTGSSDTWLIKSGFRCVDGNGNTVTTSQCNFGPAYTGGFNAKGQIPNQNFNITYGDGEFVTGVMGYQDVTVANITVPNQEVALGTVAYWNGDQTSSGLLGLAYRSLTSAYAGTDPTKNTQRMNYDPIFQTMYQQGLSDPTFALAIQRGNSGGYISFGGLPPVSNVGPYVSTPIQTLTIAGSSSYTFYTITVDNYMVGRAAFSAKTQAIVDSGTTLAYLPTATVQSVAGAFSPAATLNNAEGGYFVPCSATPPAFYVKINGTLFRINPTDMILQNIRSSDGKCLMGIQDGGSQGPFILGDVFLQNVVAVFDVGASQMRFGSHMTY